MINSSKIQKKISELNEVKKKLLSKIDFTTPTNDKVVYSTAQFKDKDGTSGSTPEDLSIILTKVMDSCVSYVNQIKKIPYVESDSNEDINRFSIFPTTSIKENGTILSSVPLDSVMNSISLSEVSHGFGPITLEVIMDGYDNDKNELYIVRINIRLLLQDYFNLSNSDKKITFEPGFINADDIFIIGLKATTDLEEGSFYTSGIIKASFSWDGKSNKKKYQFNSEQIENVFLSKNSVKSGNTYMWSIITLADTEISIEDSTGVMYPTEYDKSINNRFELNAVLSSLIAQEKRLGVSGLVLSSENFTGIRRVLCSPRYDFIQKRNLSGKVIMNNPIRLNTILKDDIDGL